MTTNAIPGPDDITRVVFENGLTVLVRENHAAPVVELDGTVPAGSVHEPAEKAGLASFASSLLTRGSESYDFDTFNTITESVGASLSTGVDSHETNFGITSLSEDFPRLVEVLADVLRRPVFPEEQIERVRNQRMVRLQERQQNTRSMAFLRFYETLYRDHPYGRATSGYLDTVPAITRDDLLTYHAERFTPNGAIIVVVGDVQTDAVLDLLQRHFGDWQGDAPDQTVPGIQPLSEVQRVMHVIPNKIQSDIVLGSQAVPRTHPDYDALRVANTVLGRFGMMGRLGEKVREEQGLAYYSYSTLDTELATGTWLAVAGVSPLNVDRATESVLAEFERLASEPVPEDELADSQAYMTGTLPLGLETNSGVASTLHSIESHGLGLDYLQRYNDLIYGVTAADVQRVAEQYLRPDAYALVVAGPQVEEPAGEDAAAQGAGE